MQNVSPGWCASSCGRLSFTFNLDLVQGTSLAALPPPVVDWVLPSNSKLNWMQKVLFAASPPPDHVSLNSYLSLMHRSPLAAVPPPCSSGLLCPVLWWFKYFLAIQSWIGCKMFFCRLASSWPFLIQFLFKFDATCSSGCCASSLLLWMPRLLESFLIQFLLKFDVSLAALPLLWPFFIHVLFRISARYSTGCLASSCGRSGIA